MATLYLLRHAEAEAMAEGGDPARGLTARGERAAAQLGRHLQARGIQPALALCSSARRARQTLDLLSLALRPPPQAVIEPALYGAAAGALLAHLQALAPAGDSVLLVAHNPGLHQLANALVGAAADADLHRLRVGLPPAGLVGLALPADDWRQLQPGAARLTLYLTPDQLD